METEVIDVVWSALVGLALGAVLGYWLLRVFPAKANMSEVFAVEVKIAALVRRVEELESWQPLPRLSKLEDQLATLADWKAELLGFRGGMASLAHRVDKLDDAVLNMWTRLDGTIPELGEREADL